MAKIGVSEFSYQFAFLYEWVMANHSFMTQVPLLPTLRDEGTGGGFDAHVPAMGINYYFQFKIPDYLERSNAAEWRIYNNEYFRFKLHRRNNYKQHMDLRFFSLICTNKVYYVSPIFKTWSEFNSAFLTSSIINKSVFIDVSTCSDYTGNQLNQNHFITYSYDGIYANQHSDYHDIQCKIGQSFVENINFDFNTTRTVELSPTYFRGKLEEAIRVHEGNEFSSSEQYSEILSNAKDIGYKEYYASYIFDKFKLVLVLAKQQASHE